MQRNIKESMPNYAKKKLNRAPENLFLELQNSESGSRSSGPGCPLDIIGKIKNLYSLSFTYAYVFVNVDTSYASGWLLSYCFKRMRNLIIA